MSKQETANALAILAESGISVTSDDVIAGMQSVVQTASKGGGLPILKLPQNNGKAGPANDTPWVFGVDSEEIGPDDLVRLDTATFKRGYFGWKDGEPESHMVSVFGGVMPDKSKLPPLGFDKQTQKEGVYKEAFEVEIEIVTGEHAGTRVRYAPSSGGASKFFGKYASAVAAASAKHAAYIFPVVELGNEETYKSKFGSHIRNPTLTIVGWTNAEGERFGAEASAEVDGAVVDVEVEEQDGTQAAPPATEAPTRRRRRTS